jgi:hypothetical protein
MGRLRHTEHHNASCRRRRQFIGGLGGGTPERQQDRPGRPAPSPRADSLSAACRRASDSFNSTFMSDMRFLPFLTSAATVVRGCAVVIIRRG